MAVSAVLLFYGSVYFILDVCVQVFPENRCIVKGVSFAHKNHVKEC